MVSTPPEKMRSPLAWPPDEITMRPLRPDTRVAVADPRTSWRPLVATVALTAEAVARTIWSPPRVIVAALSTVPGLTHLDAAAADRDRGGGAVHLQQGAGAAHQMLLPEPRMYSSAPLSTEPPDRTPPTLTCSVAPLPTIDRLSATPPLNT